MNFGVLMPVIILIVCIIIVVRLSVVYKDKIKFYSTGLDNQFKSSEIRALWRLSKECELKDPFTLYYSVPSLNKCIAMVITDSRRKGTHDSPKVQNLLDKLYKYRTRIALEAEENRGLDSSKYLEVGQKVSIILPGKGVFSSKLKGNGRELVVELPHRYDKKKKKMIILEGDQWKGHNISVYFWRKGDAMYAFDTVVFDSGLYQGHTGLFLKHSNDLVRTQKRQSIRSNCNIYAQMYMIKSEVVDYGVVERETGYKCLLEDISEDGALIRIGGKGLANVQIKLQFTIEDTFIMMYGIVKAVEYNKEINQSRLHFECIHIDPSMKNAILTYVYKVIPEAEIERNEAMMEIEKDAKEDKDNNPYAVSSVTDATQSSAGSNDNKASAEGAALENDGVTLHYNDGLTNVDDYDRTDGDGENSDSYTSSELHELDGMDFNLSEEHNEFKADDYNTEDL